MPVPLTVEVKILDSRIKEFPEWLPVYNTPGAAAMDVRACLETAAVELHPGESQMIPTGLAIHIAVPDIAAILLPRSGLGHRHGIVLGNGTGLIDSDYQGELLVSCWNRGDALYSIQCWERIAQLVFIPIIRPVWAVVEEFAPTFRGAGGFGSTGKA